MGEPMLSQFQSNDPEWVAHEPSHEPSHDGGRAHAADCGVFGFNGTTIDFAVTNTGPESWQAGDVAYDCVVLRAGILVQQENHAIVGLQPGNNFFREVPFRGGDVDGDYVASLTVIDLHTNGVLASDVSEFSSTMVPPSGGV